jgi:hypothetical protein
MPWFLDTLTYSSYPDVRMLSAGVPCSNFLKQGRRSFLRKHMDGEYHVSARGGRRPGGASRLACACHATPRNTMKTVIEQETSC